MTTMRTIGPLHFEDLEPKRFEDLVRQLAYEFRPWRRLEATGRAGGDDGFDARGFEIVNREAESSTPAEDGETAEERSPFNEAIDDRLWLIQCKRERSIGPKALIHYLDDTLLSPPEKLHGIVFVAACDFSKKARDGFVKRCREMEIEEWHLWGKAELEDRLFRPENDHLLFAYFGFSLVIRRRTQRTDLRVRLAIKRKAHRVLEDKLSSAFLLRSPNAIDYPYPGELTDFKKHPLWMVWPYMGLSHQGLKFCVGRYFAFLSDDGKSWDAAMALNEAKSHEQDDPWVGETGQDPRRQAAYEFWNNVPETNRAWLEVVGIVTFEDILDIDDLGDEYVQAPHIYATFGPGKQGPFKHFVANVETIVQWNRRSFSPGDTSEERIEYFPGSLRKSNEETAE